MIVNSTKFHSYPSSLVFVGMPVVCSRHGDDGDEGDMS